MELLECPFCGSKDVKLYKSDYTFWFVECNMCCSEGPLSRTGDEAKDKWNTRSYICKTSPVFDKTDIISEITL